MKYLGLDLGSKTLGIAISDELGMFARAYDTIRFEEDDYDFACQRTLEICKKEHICELVLGNPKHMNGEEGIRSQISYDFKAKLESTGEVKVHLIDERLTTVRVDKAMINANFRREKRHQKKDEMAAVIILQDYLDSK